MFGRHFARPPTIYLFLAAVTCARLFLCSLLGIAIIILPNFYVLAHIFYSKLEKINITEGQGQSDTRSLDLCAWQIESKVCGQKIKIAGAQNKNVHHTGLAMSKDNKKNCVRAQESKSEKKLVRSRTVSNLHTRWLCVEWDRDRERERERASHCICTILHCSHMHNHSTNPNECQSNM